MVGDDGIDVLNDKNIKGGLVLYRTDEEGKIAEIDTGNTNENGRLQVIDSGSSLKYRAGLFNGTFALNDITLIFTTPDDASESKKYRKLSMNNFSSGSSYANTYTAYNIMGTDNMTTALVIKEFSPGGVSTSSPLFLVTGFAMAYDEDEGEVNLLVGLESGAKRNVRMRDTSVKTAFNLTVGDIIRFSTDSEGYLQTVNNKVFGAPADGITVALVPGVRADSATAASSFDSEYRVVYGRVERVLGNFMWFVKEVGGVETHGVMTTTGAKVMCWNQSTQKTEIVQLSEFVRGTYFVARTRIAGDNGQLLELDIALYLSLESKWQKLINQEIYEKLTDKSQVVSLLKNTASATTALNQDSISKDFDGSVLVATILQKDWGSVRDALEYYNGKGTITLDKTEFSKLSEENKVEVYKAVKNAKIMDYTQIPAEFKRKSQAYLKSKTPSSYSGGGGGAVSTVSLPADVEQFQQQQITQKTEEKPIIFQDMNEAGWAEEAVTYLSQNKIISGVGNSLFQPNRPVTREEFVKMAVLAFKFHDASATAHFSDMPEDHWAYKYVASAKKADAVKGISDTEFGTGMNILRQDAALIAQRIYNLVDGKQQEIQEIQYEDAQEIDGYAEEAVLFMTTVGVIRGNQGKFLPKNVISRAESAMMIYNLLAKTGGVAQ